MLGSGGARGYAHIGVIEVLRERGHRIIAISGSSMGALVGGLEAAGCLADYATWAEGLSQLDVLRLLDVSLSAPGAIRGDKVFAKVRELVGELCIEDLPVPYTAVATDLYGRREMWFQNGPLELAIRASAAIPTVLTPVEIDGRLMVDGGVMNPLPLAPCAAFRADAVVAVSLHGDTRGSGAPLRAPEAVNADVESGWRGRLRNVAGHWLDRDVRHLLARSSTDAADGEAGSGENDNGEGDDSGAVLGPTAAAGRRGRERVSFAGVGKLEVMNQSFETMQAVLTQHRLAGYPPDVLVRVPKDACRSLDFHRAAELIELGRTLTAATLDAAEAEGRF